MHLVQEFVDEHTEGHTYEDLQLEVQQTKELLQMRSMRQTRICFLERFRSSVLCGEKSRGFVEKNHPDKAFEIHVFNLFNDNTLSHFG